MTTDDGTLNPSTSSEANELREEIATLKKELRSVRSFIRNARRAFGILVFSFVVGLFFLQRNYQQDDVNQVAQTNAVCHALADVNQSVIDVVTIQAIDTPITDTMSPDLKAATQRANSKRQVYRDIVLGLFPLPPCDDGYRPASKAAPYLDRLRAEAVAPTPTGTTTTTR